MKIRCFTILGIHKQNIDFFYYTFIDFIMLLYTFLVVSFAPYKKCIIYHISFSKFSDVLTFSPYFVLYLTSEITEEQSLNNLITASLEL